MIKAAEPAEFRAGDRENPPNTANRKGSVARWGGFILLGSLFPLWGRQIDSKSTFLILGSP